VSNPDDMREVLRELLPDLLREALAPAANGNGHAPAEPEAPVVPQVPAPPVAAVLRPSTWTAPRAPGEIIGDDGVGRNPHYVRKTSQAGDAETVSIASDEELNQFVQELAARLEDPREGRAIRSGQVRFTLGRTTAPAGTPATMRIEKGAVTERVVREAKSAGARLVLAPGAVLTPLARDKAKALGVQIEKERRC
jgi:hypothetical protein